jgi:hypothetical protein
MTERDKSREARMDRMASMAASPRWSGQQRAKFGCPQALVTKQIEEPESWHF